MTSEELAKRLAFWHGQKIVARDRDNTWITVASRARGTVYDANNQTERYVHDHWREYTACADFVLAQFIQTRGS